MFATGPDAVTPVVLVGRAPEGADEIVLNAELAERLGDRDRRRSRRWPDPPSTRCTRRFPRNFPTYARLRSSSSASACPANPDGRFDRGVSLTLDGLRRVYEPPSPTTSSACCSAPTRNDSTKCWSRTAKKNSQPRSRRTTRQHRGRCPRRETATNSWRGRWVRVSKHTESSSNSLTVPIAPQSWPTSQSLVCSARKASSSACCRTEQRPRPRNLSRSTSTMSVDSHRYGDVRWD